MRGDVELNPTNSLTFNYRGTDKMGGGEAGRRSLSDDCSSRTFFTTNATHTYPTSSSLPPSILPLAPKPLDEFSIDYSEFLTFLSNGYVDNVDFLAPNGDKAYATITVPGNDGFTKRVRIGKGEH